MIYYALVFLVVACIAGVLGFSGIAGTAANIAWILFIVGLVLAAVFFANDPGRADRKRKEREQEQEYRKRRDEEYWTQYREWSAKVNRANGKAELAAEKGDGNSALAWLKIAEELQKQRPPSPWTYY